MTNIPQHYGTLPYATPVLQDPNVRPTSVTILAYLGIIAGVLQLLGQTCMLPGILNTTIHSKDPFVDAIRQDAVLNAIRLTTCLVTMVLAAFELIACFAMLQLNPAGRGAMLMFAMLDMAFIIFSTAIGVLVVQDRVVSIMQTTLPGMGKLQAAGAMTTMQNLMSLGSYLGLIWLIWPGLVMFFLNQPRVKFAFGVQDEDAASVPL